MGSSGSDTIAVNVGWVLDSTVPSTGDTSVATGTWFVTVNFRTPPNWILGLAKLGYAFASYVATPHQKSCDENGDVTANVIDCEVDMFADVTVLHAAPGQILAEHDESLQ